MSITVRGQRTRSRAAKREELSQLLLDTLEEHLSSESFTEISVDRLVNQAGVSRSAFYLHFGSKTELLETLYAHVVEQLIASAQTWWSLPPDASKEDLREGFRILLTTYRRHARLMAAVAEVAAYDAGLRAEFDAMMTHAVGEVAQHITLGQRTGAVRDGLDADAVAACLTWMTERVLLQILGSVDPDEADRHLCAMVDVYWHTLYEAGRRPQTDTSPAARAQR